MLEEGYETTGDWNYYGGGWELVGADFDYVEARKSMLKLRDVIKVTGIDWTKTEIPTSSENSQFNDTEGPSTHVSSLFGKLVLKDGSEHLIGVSNSERRFSEYMLNLSQLATDKQRVKDILGEELG